MVEIKAFPGLRYDPQRFPDLAAVLCPPYDVISPEADLEYRRSSDHNIIHLEIPRPDPQDVPRETGDGDKYARAAATLDRWLKEGVLLPEEPPAIYLHRHHFHHRGKRFNRRGLMAAVRLEEWEKRVVIPHEATGTSAKDDRLRLIRATRANISPILAFYDDPGGQISSLLEQKERERPTAFALERQGEGHELWAITDPHLIRGIAEGLGPQPLYIADGHHRYETALNFRNEQRGTGTTGDDASNFVLMTLVDARDPGLVVLPVHRLVRGIPPDVLKGFKEWLGTLFEIETYPLADPDPGEDFESFCAGKMARGGPDPVLGLLGLEAGAFFVLKGRRKASARMMPRGGSAIYRRQDVCLLQHLVVENMLGSPREGVDLAYTHSAQDAQDRLWAGEYQLAFLLSPMDVSVIKQVADGGERLPGKSTYFYPKLPTGLALHRLVGEQ